MRKERFLPEADCEVMEAADWYRNQSAGLEFDFTLCIDEALAKICRSPGMFPKAYRHLRRVIVKRFPYAIYFHETDTEIIIYAVMHTSRHPKRWKRRA